MKKGMKRSKGRAVSSRAAKGKRPAVKAVRRPKAKSVKPKRKATPAKPKPKAVAAAAKGPSVTTLQRRIQTLEGQQGGEMPPAPPAGLESGRAQQTRRGQCWSS